MAGPEVLEIVEAQLAKGKCDEIGYSAWESLQVGVDGRPPPYLIERDIYAYLSEVTGLDITVLSDLETLLENTPYDEADISAILDRTKEPISPAFSNGFYIPGEAVVVPRISTKDAKQQQRAESSKCETPPSSSTKTAKGSESTASEPPATTAKRNRRRRGRGHVRDQPPIQVPARVDGCLP
jgi:hypothetical protein